MPKPLDPAWAHFECITKTANSGKWARCKKCKKEMQGIPARLKKHFQNCGAASAVQCDSNDHGEEDDPRSRSDESAPGPSPLKKPKVLKQSTLLPIVSRTSSSLKGSIQIGKYFYATNTPFEHAAHEEFKKMCELLRPGYKPPSPFQIGGKILEDVHKTVGETVSMSLDGWSNVHNQPIVCCSIMTQRGLSVLVDTVDTSGNSHTAQYLKEVAVEAIKKTEADFHVKVRRFVTDNTANVLKMRQKLEEDVVNVIQYGCSAHLAQLLAEDVQIPGVKEQIVKLIKYFRNKHLPAAWYKAAGGKMLILPQEVRWNTVTDSIRSYLENRGILVQVCQDHRAAIDKDVFKIVNDIHVMVNATDFMERMIPIAVALDRLQRDSTTIAVAVEVWNRLGDDLKDQPRSVLESFKKRSNMALGPPHFLANIMDHRFRGQHLNSEQKGRAFEFLNSMNADSTPLIMALITESEPFPKYLFGRQFRTTLPMVWWKSVPINEWPNRDKTSFLELCEGLLTAVASSAGLERIFSSFGLVQSKLRNRLGNDKASKLVFLFKYLNQTLINKKSDLEWIWKTQAEDSEGPALPTVPAPSLSPPGQYNRPVVQIESDSDGTASESEDELPLISLISKGKR